MPVGDPIDIRYVPAYQLLQGLTTSKDCYSTHSRVKMRPFLLTTALAILTPHQASAATFNSTACTSLSNLRLSNGSQINLAVSLPSGSNFTGNSVETSYNTAQANLPALCRVAFEVETSPNSTALAEIWLPEPSTWNGRFLAVGNGGFAGGVNYPDIVWGARKGFATMSTNTGHDSTSSNGTWMLDNPEALVDFGHRALHVTTGVAKMIVEAYYGMKEGQGLNAVQRYPNDYDGVLVGSAIPSQTNTSAWQIYVALEQFPNNRSSYIPGSMWTTIDQAVLEQCDGLDGVEDGIIMDPRECQFQPEVLLCSNGTTTDCLNIDQLLNLKRMYTPWLDSTNHTINPGLSPSGEEGFSYLMNGAEPQFGPSFYRYAVFNDSAWDWSTLTPETVRFAQEMNPGGMNAYNPDMRGFEKKGGKILQYHGFADPVIPAGVAWTWAEAVEKFYESVGRSGGVDDFFRLFMVPGMGHCSGGVGAWVLDAASQDGISPLQDDSSHSMLWSLVGWVEKGEETAPESVTATKYVNDTAALGVDFERDVCRWPNVAWYVDENETWVCPGVGGH
ncbi:hypothetical protein PRZ48_013480 [Zasmidium cellare]|uniref:Carboxylic ester hydrolase n=1 Tax=Zasmidium cellare TaxID=395010 RepID=A0ABR0E151_ZASCE|nr:hypothetical protein PRZ48_013480 [Zasmidium cellare]